MDHFTLKKEEIYWGASRGNTDDRPALFAGIGKEKGRKSFLYQANQFSIGNHTSGIHATAFFDDVSAVGVDRVWADE